MDYFIMGREGGGCGQVKKDGREWVGGKRVCGKRRERERRAKTVWIIGLLAREREGNKNGRESKREN